MNYFILNPFPVPRPARSDNRWQRIVSLAGQLACTDKRFSEWAIAIGTKVRKLEESEKSDMMQELDAVVAHLYGLSESHLRHVFETFHEGWDFSARLEGTLKHYRVWSERGDA